MLNIFIVAPQGHQRHAALAQRRCGRYWARGELEDDRQRLDRRLSFRLESGNMEVAQSCRDGFQT